MKGKRRLFHESLEKRRLLAASCQAAEPAVEVSVPLGEVVSDAAGQAVQEDVGLRTSILPLLPHHDFTFGPDLIHEQGNRIVVVDQAPFGFEGGNLFIFERADDGSLEVAAEVAIEFPVERMIVHGDQVLLLGNNFNWFVLDHSDVRVPPGSISADGISADGISEDGVSADGTRLPQIPQTTVVTVNLGDEVEVIRQDLDGHYLDIHHEDDRLIMVSSRGREAMIAIYPPPTLLGTVNTYDITADGLRKVASNDVPIFGVTRVHGQDFYSANTEHPEILVMRPQEIAADGSLGDSTVGDRIRVPNDRGEPAVTLSRVRIDGADEDTLETIELGIGFLNHFELAEDGRTGVVVRSEFLGVGPMTSVDLLDLSGDTIRVFETISLPDFNGQVLVAGPEYIVLRSFENNTLVVIDANQQIDVDAESRIRRIEFPADLRLNYEFVQVSADRIVLRGHRPTAPNEGDRRDLDTFAPQAPEQTILLTVSLSEARIIADTHLPEDTTPHGSGKFFLIDSATERFGFLSGGWSFIDANTEFVFGRLNETGEFEPEGSLPIGSWLEIDVNPERLLVRQTDQLVEYNWDNTDDPRITPMGDPDPAIEAVNDEYTLHADGEDHVLEVLANDVIHHFRFAPRAEIIELVGAPTVRRSSAVRRFGYQPRRSKMSKPCVLNT